MVISASSWPPQSPLRAERKATTRVLLYEFWWGSKQEWKLFLINGITVETSSIRLYLPSYVVTRLSWSQTTTLLSSCSHSQTQAQEQPGKLHQWSMKGLAASEVWIIQHSRTKPVSPLISAIKSCNILHPELMVAYGFFPLSPLPAAGSKHCGCCDVQSQQSGAILLCHRDGFNRWNNALL